MNKKVIYSSASDDWETPQWLFDELNEKYHFTTDVCASASNAKCENFYSKEIDALTKEWTGVCWCNPPYGREISKWVEKAANSSATVVMLLPARTDRKWFHDYCLRYGKVTFLKGRLKFNEKTSKNPAPFASMIVVFESEEKND